MSIAIPGLNVAPTEVLEDDARRVEEADFFDYLWTGDERVPSYEGAKEIVWAARDVFAI